MSRLTRYLCERKLRRGESGDAQALKSCTILDKPYLAFPVE